MTDLISLIVPVYNGASFLPALIDRFEKETYPDIELVIVDDGSSDDTLVSARDFAGKDQRIKVIHQENSGPSCARNTGIRESRGKYVCFADIDDYFYPEYVGYLYKLIKKYDADVACCNYKKVTDITSHIDDANASDECLVYERDEAINRFCYRKNLTGYSYLKLISRECLKDVFFNTEIVYGEDFLFTYDVLKQSHRVAYGSRILYLYWQNLGSATHIHRDNTLKYKKAWDAHMEFLRDVRKHYPGSYVGAVGKCYLLAINDVTRVYDLKRDQAFVRELYSFIRKHAKTVLKDRTASVTTRALGVAGFISPKLTCSACKFAFDFMEKHGLTFKRTM